MVVLNPAITVRPEQAAYSFEEDDAAATVVFVARTAPGLPRPQRRRRLLGLIGRQDGRGGIARRLCGCFDNVRLRARRLHGLGQRMGST